MRVLSFLNVKGGVGKTTTSLNVATGLAAEGKKVLLIDYDPQANSTSVLLSENTTKYTIDELIFEPQLTKKAIITVDKNLDLIASRLHLAYAEAKLANATTLPQQYRLIKIIKELDNNYDFIIIDCPPIINLLTINAILASNSIIIPIKPDKFAVAGFNITIDNIVQIQQNFNVAPSYKVLFTMINRNNMDRDIIEQLCKVVDVYDTKIRYQAKPITRASLFGTTVIISDEKSNVAKDYKSLISEILEETNND